MKYSNVDEKDVRRAVEKAMCELRLVGIDVSKVYVDRAARAALGPEIMTCQGPTQLIVDAEQRWECINSYGAVVYDGLQRNEAELIAKQHGLTGRPKR